MLKVLFGTQKATDKNIHINGRHIKHAYAHRALLNYVPQFSFFPSLLTVEKAVREFGVSLYKVLDDFPDLEPDTDKNFSELSGGRERLWSVLILLFAETAFTLLDEPFTHIMPLHINTLKKVLLREKDNKGIILTDHLYKPLLEISDTVYLIRESKSYLIRDLSDLSLHGYVRENVFD
jgi:ABC-type multidrug transport system ATPase subunit